MKNIYSIIVTYNGSAWIEKCLESLLNSNYPTGIIVVDNGSSDNTIALIEQGFPKVELIRATVNLGFGQANNIGMQRAYSKGADYFFLLNQDAWIEPDSIETLVKLQVDHPSYGILSPIHLNGTGTAMDQYFLQYLQESNPSTFVETTLTGQPFKDELIPTPFVNAAAWLLTADCYRKTGGFDPLFFHYGEDSNYAQRAIYHGFKIGICTHSSIYHDREKRLSENNPDIERKIKKEWIQLLVYTCDINRPAWLVFSLRRFSSYVYSGMQNLFRLQKTESYLNFKLAFRLAMSLRKIHESRKESAYAVSFPHIKK